LVFGVLDLAHTAARLAIKPPQLETDLGLDIKFRLEVHESEDQRVDAMTGIDEGAGAPVNAHQFIIDSIYSPEQIKAIGEAFVGAWARIPPTAGACPEVVSSFFRTFALG
jgi:hypothetical protein